MDGSGAEVEMAEADQQALALTRRDGHLVVTSRGYEAANEGRHWAIWNTRARVWDEDILSRDGGAWECRERMGEAPDLRSALAELRRFAGGRP
jgi:hypothetical protein